MELRHLRYFIAVAEAANFTKAAAKMRVAQPALSRQVMDLEDELGVDLMKRSPRGITLTAEGKLFLEEARSIISAAEMVVSKVQALARGDYGELHIGYGPSPSIELLPPAMIAFQRANPRVNVKLHDLAGDELITGLHDGSLELCVMSAPMEETTAGIEFHCLKTYSICVAMSPHHPLAKRKAVTLDQVREESLVAFRRREYTNYHHLLASVFGGPRKVPRIAVECDGANSLVTEIEAGRGVAILPSVFVKAIGPRLKLRPISPAPEPLRVGCATAIKGDLTPAGEKFIAVLKRVAEGTERGFAPQRLGGRRGV
jgi:DNA-binding transcriptional LysR family regulator